MEVITKETEEVRAYFEALEQGMRYIDTVTAHFRPAMNGEVYLHGRGRMQDIAHHAKDVAGLPHATAYPVYIAAGQDALPPVGLAAYAGRELRGYAAKAQTREKPNMCTGVRIGICSEGRNTAFGVPAFAVFCTGASSRFTQGGTLPVPVFRPCPCPSSPARSAAWRRGCRRLPGSRSRPSDWSLRRRFG